MAQAGNNPPGWRFYDPNTAPRIYDIVLCRFPFDEDPANPPPRRSPCLVRRVRVNSKIPAAYVTVAFGTTNLMGMDRLAFDLIIQNAKSMQEHGLRQATRFDLSQRKTAELPWSEEWFPLPYRRLTPILGSLNKAAITQLMHAAENRRNHNFL